MPDTGAVMGGKPVKTGAVGSKIGLIALIAWMLGAFKTIVEYLKSAIDNKDLISDLLFYVGGTTITSIIIWYVIAIAVFPPMELLCRDKAAAYALNQKAMPYALMVWAFATIGVSFHGIFIEGGGHSSFHPFVLLGHVRLLVQIVGLLVTAVSLFLCYATFVSGRSEEQA